MKKFLFVLVLGSFSALAQQPSGQIVYADTEYIIARMPAMKELQDKVMETQTKLQGEYNEKTQQLQKMYADYTAALSTMADSTRQKTETALQQLNAELQQFPQDARVTIENTRKLYMAPVYLQVGKAIDQVARENGFSAILPLKIGDFALLVYADKKMDVSDLVLQKLGITTEPEEKTASPENKKTKQ